MLDDDLSDDAPQAYDYARGAGGLARDFKRGLERTVAKSLNVRRPDANETRDFLKDAFADNYKQIERDHFVKVTKKWQSLKKLDLKKSELRKIFHTIDKSSGGFGTINYKDILEYCKLGEGVSKDHGGDDE